MKILSHTNEIEYVPSTMQKAIGVTVGPVTQFKNSCRLNKLVMAPRRVGVSTFILSRAIDAASIGLEVCIISNSYWQHKSSMERYNISPSHRKNIDFVVGLPRGKRYDLTIVENLEFNKIIENIYELILFSGNIEFYSSVINDEVTLKKLYQFALDNKFQITKFMKGKN